MTTFATDVEQAAELGAGVISGCVVSAGTGATVNVAAGVIRAGFQRYPVRALNGWVGNTLAPTNNATGATRYDRVWARYDGSCFILTGGATAPQPPNAADGVVLAMLTIPNGSSTPSAITDERIIVDQDDSATNLPVFNRNPAMRRSDASLETARTGGVHRTLIVGDSLFEGYGLYWADRVQTKLRPAIQKLVKGAVGGSGYEGIQHGSGVPAWEWTVAGSPDYTDYGYGLGRRAINLNAAGTSITRTETCDRFLIFYAKGSGGGGIKVTIDGTPRTSFGSNGATAAAQVWDSGAITAGSHTIKIEPDNTMAAPNNIYGAFIEGVMFFNGDYTSGCQFLDGTHVGFMAYDFASAASGGPGDSWYQAVNSEPVDLLIIELGSNEEWYGWGLTGSGAYEDSVKSIVDTVTTANAVTGAPAPSVLLVIAWEMVSSWSDSLTGVAYNNGSNIVYAQGGTDKNKFHAYDIGKTITAGWLAGGSATIQDVMEAPVPGEWSQAKLSANANATATGQTVAITGRSSAYSATDGQVYRHAGYEVARANGYAVLDLWELMGWAGDDANTNFGLGDGIHWDASGAERAADAVCVAVTGAPLPA